MDLFVLSGLFLANKHRYKFAGVLLLLCGPSKAALLLFNGYMLCKSYTFLENFLGYVA